MIEFGFVDSSQRVNAHKIFGLYLSNISWGNPDDLHKISKKSLTVFETLNTESETASVKLKRIDDKIQVFAQLKKNENDIASKEKRPLNFTLYEPLRDLNFAKIPVFIASNCGRPGVKFHIDFDKEPWEKVRKFDHKWIEFRQTQNLGASSGIYQNTSWNKTYNAFAFDLLLTCAIVENKNV